MTGAEMGCERMLRPLTFAVPWLSRLLFARHLGHAPASSHPGRLWNKFVFQQVRPVSASAPLYLRATIIIADAYMKAPATTGTAT